MRIAINALFLQEPHTGTGRYLFNLLNALGRVDGINEYLILRPHEPTDAPETPSTFEWQTVPLGRFQQRARTSAKVVWEQPRFPLGGQARRRASDAHAALRAAATDIAASADSYHP